MSRGLELRTVQADLELLIDVRVGQDASLRLHAGVVLLRTNVLRL